jgi:TolA-binding protein
MPDWEKEGRQAKEKIAELEKRVKSLEGQMSAQYQAHEQLLRRVEALEREKSSTQN